MGIFNQTKEKLRLLLILLIFLASLQCEDSIQECRQSEDCPYGELCATNYGSWFTDPDHYCKKFQNRYCTMDSECADCFDYNNNQYVCFYNQCFAKNDISDQSIYETADDASNICK